MNRIGNVATGKVVQRLTAPEVFQPAQIRLQNAAADLTERSEAVAYPWASVYCERIVNSLVEKFRSFSGTLQMVVEVRASHDRLENLHEGLEQSVDGVMAVLDGCRGDWGDGMYYCGGYQAAFGAAKRGGKNYLQTAKITFEIGVSIS